MLDLLLYVSRSPPTGCGGRTLRSLVFGMPISPLASVVIREFNIVGVPIFESKTCAPLVIDGNRVLPFSFPFRFVKSIARGDLQILQPCCVIDIFQPPYCPP